MTFIMLSILLMVLPYFLIAGYYDEEESIGRQSRSIGPATQANEKGVEVQEKQHENPPFQQEAPNAYPTPHVATQNWWIGLNILPLSVSSPFFSESKN